LRIALIASIRDEGNFGKDGDEGLEPELVQGNQYQNELPSPVFERMMTKSKTMITHGRAEF
jgi:hypothetical protein